MNLTVLPDAFDYPASIPSGGDYLGAVDITTTDGGNLLDNWVELCYRDRQYELTPLLVLEGSAYRDINPSENPSYHEEWTWNTTTNTINAFAKLQDDTTATSEEDFIGFADRATNGRRNWLCRATGFDGEFNQLIGGMGWTYKKWETLDGIEYLMVDESGSYPLYLSFELAWAPGSVSPFDPYAYVPIVYPPDDFPSIVGDDFAPVLRFGAFIAIEWPSEPTDVEAPWAWSPYCVYPYDSGEHPIFGSVSINLERDTFHLDFGIVADLIPTADVVITSETHSLSFELTPNLSFSWT